MSAPKRGPALSFFWRLHKWLLFISGGRLGSKIGDLPVLVLYTVGRKSGKSRANALYYVAHGNAYAVVASNVGADANPGWYLNLREQPMTRIQVQGKDIQVKWREATGAESDALYDKFIQADPNYAEYKNRTNRKIPVVILEPTTATK